MDKASRSRITDVLEKALVDDQIIDRDAGIAVMDPDGGLIYANEVFACLHDRARAGLMGARLHELVPDTSVYTIARAGIRAGAEIWTFTAQHLGRGGTPFYVDASLIPMPAGREYNDHYLLIIRRTKIEHTGQIEIEKRQDLRLMEQQGINQAILRAFDDAPGAIFFTDTKGSILYANRAAAQVFGDEAGDFTGRNLNDLLPLRKLAGVKEFWAHAATDTRWSGEFTLEREGIARSVQVALSWVVGDGPKSNLVFGSSRDVTELRLLEKHMRQAQKLEAIGLLASGLAHNINSPLSAIVMTAEMALFSNPEAHEFKDILTATTRINEIVANLMTKSRQEQSATEMEIDLNQMVQTELKFLEANLFFKHNVERDVQLADQLPIITALYSDFSQAFQNLISNAIDAMSESEVCELKVKTQWNQDDAAIVITVADTGIGIAPDNLEKIFQPFFTTKAHLDQTEPGRPSGTGLGLSTARHLLERYGARIEVSSRPGKGSEFRMIVPVPAD